MAEGKPAALEQEPGEEEVSLLAGHMRDDTAALNQQPLTLGLLKARLPLLCPAYPHVSSGNSKVQVLLHPHARLKTQLWSLSMRCMRMRVHLLLPFLGPSSGFMISRM